jgi:hypothetical protein
VRTRSRCREVREVGGAGLRTKRGRDLAALEVRGFQRSRSIVEERRVVSEREELAPRFARSEVQRSRSVLYEREVVAERREDPAPRSARSEPARARSTSDEARIGAASAAVVRAE